MDRYSLIDTKLKREFVLLQGLGCRWRRCAFCNYHEDVSESPYEINKEVLSQVTGVHGVLDVINSGSAMHGTKVCPHGLLRPMLQNISKVSACCAVPWVIPLSVSFPILTRHRNFLSILVLMCSVITVLQSRGTNRLSGGLLMNSILR